MNKKNLIYFILILTVGYIIFVNYKFKNDEQADLVNTAINSEQKEMVVVAKDFLERKYPGIKFEGKKVSVTSEQNSWKVVFEPTREYTLGGGAIVVIDKKTKQVISFVLGQ